LKVGEFEIIPKMEITLSKEEIENLYRCAEAHYDRVCRNQARPGGFLFALYNIVTHCGQAWESHFFTSRELNLLCKITESPLCDPSIFIPVRAALNALELKYRDLNKRTR
jgi:hypothetical protein